MRSGRRSHTCFRSAPQYPSFHAFFDPFLALKTLKFTRFLRKKPLFATQIYFLGRVQRSKEIVIFLRKKCILPLDLVFFCSKTTLERGKVEHSRRLSRLFAQADSTFRVCWFDFSRRLIRLFAWIEGNEGVRAINCYLLGIVRRALKEFFAERSVP